MLAEDNAADAALVREALREHGVDCALHVVKDGAQAISFIRDLDSDINEPRLDLFLLDMHLPRHHGDEILEALLATERYAHTPVILMTSSTSPLIRQTAEKHASMHYFRKPSSLAEFMLLGGIIKNVLAGRTPFSSDSASGDEDPGDPA